MSLAGTVRSAGSVRSAGTARWRLGLAALVLLLTFLPLAEWIGLPRRELRPPWLETIALWTFGIAIVLGVAVVAQILSRGRAASALARMWDAYRSVPDRALATALGLWVLGLSVVVAHFLFSRNPILVDAVVQLFQAKTFAAGRLWAPAPAYPEFFLTQHMIVDGDKFFAHFPPGHPAIVALGLRAGLPAWIVSPLVTAGAAVLGYAAIRRIAGRDVGHLSAPLFAFSPFLVFMAGEQMNHGTTLLFLSAAFYALVRGREADRAAWFVGAGIAFGLAFATRPLDAVAWATALGAWLLWERRARALALIVAGGLPVAALVFGYNAATTGDPFLFGYIHLWGRSHALGFHADPWGDPYTPVSALAFLNLDLRRLSLLTFEWPIPLALALVPAIVLWEKGLDRAAAALAATAAAVLVASFFYWHHGLYLGPRMLYTAIPGIVLLTAVGLRSLDRVAGGWRGAYRVGVVAAFAIAGWQAAQRAREYAHPYFTMKLHPDRQAERAGIRNALVFVAESWASRMLARLWALGVPPDEVEQAYRQMDSCEMDETLEEADRRLAAGADSAGVRAWLRAELRARRAATAGVEWADTDTLPDHTLRLRADRPLTARCRALIAQDYEGFSLYTPFLPLNSPTLDGDLVFARDLRERNLRLMREYPGRSYWRYTPLTPVPGVVPRFVPIDAPVDPP